jgi:hypothetical protein
MKIITIMPDFGMSPYAWERDETDEHRGVGGAITDSVCGFENTPYKVSAALQREFREWAVHFERNAGYPGNIDWPRFHEIGLALAKRLKKEIGDQARVVYERPYEDPIGRRLSPVEVLADGTLRRLPLRRSI